MRLPLAFLALALCGCGGSVVPELYALVLDTITLPSTCFVNPPSGSVAKGPLGTLKLEVWDGPDSKAFALADAALQFDMGSAPNVDIARAEALEGSSAGPTGWTFAADRDATVINGIGGITQSVNTKTHLAVTFPRAPTGKGTLSLSSSSTCTGTGCGASTACTLDSIALRATRLAVDFERAP